jgi:hypothetical protein
MPYAQIAAQYITAWCRATYAKNPDKMGSTMANGGMIDCFDHRGHGSHKYIPADKLTEDLGERQGAGVYGYWAMNDGSYLLLTCRGDLAWWSGKNEDKAQWHGLRSLESTERSSVEVA